MSVDWQQIGTAIGGLALGAGGVGMWWRKQRVGSAESTAQVSVLEMMRQEVERLGKRVAALETESKVSAAQQHRLIRHILRLEGLMRAGNLEPPHFDIDGQPEKVGLTD